MKAHRNLEIIAGRCTSAGDLQRCNDERLGIAHASGSQVYEFQFPYDFKILAFTATPYTQNAQVAVYVPSPTAGAQADTIRVSTQAPIGTNAPCDFDFIAVGYPR